MRFDGNGGVKRNGTRDQGLYDFFLTVLYLALL